ncbi:VOC family protein [Massilia sp. SR12]
MNKSVIFNLPVRDVEQSRAFFSALGFSFKQEFCSPDAAFMNIAGDTVQAMLMTEAFFRSLTNKPVVRAKEGNEVIICLSCDSRAEVDSLIAKALAAGATSPHPPEDEGFMYHQGFEDIDGHLWNLVWVAPQD